MVKIIENPIKMDDLGGKPTIFGNTHIENMCFFVWGGVGVRDDFLGIPPSISRMPV